MSAPLRSILNDRDISPPTRSTRPRVTVEPVSASSASTPIGPPEPLSAGSTETGFGDHRAGRSSSRPTRAIHSTTEAAATRHGRDGGDFRTNTGYSQQQAVRQGGATQPAPQLVDPSLSSLAKRRRSAVHQQQQQQQTSSSPPRSPPKRRRLPDPAPPDLSSHIPQAPRRPPPPPPPQPTQPISAADMPIQPIFRSRPLPNSVQHHMGHGLHPPTQQPMSAADMPIQPIFRSRPLPNSVQHHTGHGLHPPTQQPMSAADMPIQPIFRSRPLPNSVQHPLPSSAQHRIRSGPHLPTQQPMSALDLPLPPIFRSRPLPGSIQHRPAPPLRAAPRRPFDIFGAILTHPDITLYLATHLSFPCLLTLYTSSRAFHHIANHRFTALVLGNASVHVPSALRAFPFRCYRRLCRGDPARRPHEQLPGKLRIVPSFRYLQMVLWRQRVVDEIIALLQAHGLVMSASTPETLCKLWFMMDLPDNRRRIGLVRNTVIWDNGDLWRATEFFIKVDMRFTHPETGSGSGDLRKLMMAQKSLSTLWRVLKREECRTQLEVLRMAVRTHYISPSHRNLPILGVPPNRIGALQWEGYGSQPGKRLLQIHQLVMREAIRREVPLQKWYLDMALDGFVDKKEEGEHLWKNVVTQQEVEVVDVEIDEEGNEIGEESDWESEDEYFPEEKHEEDEEDEEADPHPGLMGLNLFFDTDDTEFCETVAEYARYQERVRAGFRAQREAMQR